MHVVIAWILALMVAHSPVDRYIGDPYAQESVQEIKDRYLSIASDIAAIAYDEGETPIFPGDNGRLETAALLAGIAFWEGGGYRKDIDTGDGPHARGDHGNSVCIMQINIGTRRTMEGYTMDDLLADRKNCIRAGLHVAAYSFRVCGALPIDQRLRAYASGSCHRGSLESQERVMTGLSWFYGHRPHFDDGEVLRLARFERDRNQPEVMVETWPWELAKN